MIFFGYIIPTLVIQAPSGTDVYTHMAHTQRMRQVYSLDDFYERSFSEESLSYDYPFGLWYYTSIVMKVTGMDINTVVYVLPLVLVLVSVLLMYVYALELLASEKKAILATIFFLSMPLMAIGMLNFSTSRFTTVFLIMIVFLTIRQMNLRSGLIVGLLIFTLVFTHTGTFMFLMFFSIAYFILAALLWQKFDKPMYFLIVGILFVYIITINFFPFIQPQYVDKGRMIITTSESISKVLHLDIIGELGRNFYENMYVSNDFIYFFFWSAFIYAAGKIAIIIHAKCKSHFHANYAGLPVIGNVKTVSHGIVTAPFWLGPFHTIFSIFGVFKLDMRGKCVALALFFSALLPGAMQSDAGTGSLRELYYLFLIVPVCAAAGFYYLLPRLEKMGTTPVRRKLRSGFFLLLFISLMLAPIIGSLYYQPTIAGGKEEKVNLNILSTFGTPDEGVADFTYNERIDIYANKTTPGIPSGNEKKQYTDALHRIYLRKNSESAVSDLNSFNIQYVLTSNRILKELDTPRESLTIDSNKNLDRIISSSNNFSVYHVIPQSTAVTIEESDQSDFIFVDPTPAIHEMGSVFMVENDFYKVKIGRDTPQFYYIGTPTTNLLGEGMYSDYITLSWGGTEYQGRFVNYDLNELKYTNISVKGNTITYQTTIRDSNTTQEWASFAVKYTFYEKAIRREIFVANDYVSLSSPGDLYAAGSQSIYAPFTRFVFTQITPDGTKDVTKKIYPAQDSVVIKEKKYSDIFFEEADSGIYIRFDDSAPYPDLLTYLGSQIYTYGHVSMSATSALSPSASARRVQYYSIGPRQVAVKNVDYYTSVSPYLYREAIKPVIITGYITPVSYPSNMSGNASLNTTLPKIQTVPSVNQGDLPLYKELADRQIPYTVGLTPDTTTALPSNVIPIGYARLARGNAFLDTAGLDTEITSVSGGEKTRGIMFQYFAFNLETIRLLAEKQIPYAEGFTVSSPNSEFDREGARTPSIGYLRGQLTDVVLIPVTWPTSSMLKPYLNTQDTFEDWKNTIDAVSDYGGVAVFSWNAEDVVDPDYLAGTLKIVNYSQEKMMTFTTMEEIATHQKLLNNVRTRVTKGVDSVNFSIRNLNSEPVMGVTYRVGLPEFNYECPYDVKNGRLVRYTLVDRNCILYVSTDLEARESLIMTVEPEVSRKNFTMDFSDVYAGRSTVYIRDTNGSPVSGAQLMEAQQVSESDQNGKMNLTLPRGRYTVTVEKPGYYSQKVDIVVRGRFFQMIDIVRSRIFGQ